MVDIGDHLQYKGPGACYKPEAAANACLVKIGMVSRSLGHRGARSGMASRAMRHGGWFAAGQVETARDKASRPCFTQSGGMVVSGEFQQPMTQLRAVTELRSVIEGFAARTAARRIAEGADKRPLLTSFARLERAAAAGDPAAAIAADRDLHVAIVRAAQVDILEGVWEAVANAMEWFRVENTLNLWPDLKLHAETHRPLVDTICAGDVVAAEDSAIAHMEAVWYRLAGYTGDASLPSDPLSLACGYLALHLSEPIRLDFVAKYVAKTSPGHLSRLFRETHGVGFAEYLRELRIRKAAKLVATTSQPIQRVAASVGYHDASRFAEHFRRRFGSTPLDYRRRHRGTR